MKNLFLSLLFIAGIGEASLAQYARHEWSNHLVSETYLDNGDNYLVQDHIEVDPFGNSIGAGTYKSPVGDSGHFILKKTNAEGELLWIKAFGEEETDEDPYIFDVESDDEGNIYILGVFRGWLDVDAGPEVSLVGSVANMKRHFFIAKYDPEGQFLWAYHKESLHLFPSAIAFNEITDSIVLLGFYYNRYTPLIVDADSAEGTLEPCMDGQEIFLLSISNDGYFNWINNFGDEQHSTRTRGFDILVNEAGELIVGANIDSVLDIDGEQVGVEDSISYIILKFDGDGEPDLLYALDSHMHPGLWNWLFFLSYDITGNSTLPIASWGNLYLHNEELWLQGVCRDAITINDTVIVSSNPSFSRFLLKFDPDPQELIHVELPGYYLPVEFSGNDEDLIVITGQFNQTMDFDWTEGERILSPGGDKSSYILVLSPDGDFISADVLSSSSESFIRDMAYAGENKFLFTGVFDGDIEMAVNGDSSILYQSNDSIEVFELLIDIKYLKAVCQDTVELEIDQNGQFVLSAEFIDDGSYTNYDTDLLYTLDTYLLDCQTIGDGQYVELSVEDSTFGYVEKCKTYILPKFDLFPTALCADITLSLTDTGILEINAEDIDAGSYDDCHLASLSLSQYSFDCTDIGENTVTLTATGGSGMTSICEAKVSIQDISAPSIDCSDQVVYLNENGLPNLEELYERIDVIDNCSLKDVAFYISVDDCMDEPVEYPLEIIAEDIFGNESYCLSTVFVLDTISPTVICSDFTFNLINDEAQLVLSLEDISTDAWDNCQLDNVSFFPEILDINDLGDNTILVEATDVHGNTGSCTAEVFLTTPIRKEELLYIPNVFSPNNDGVNDQFAPFCSSKVELVTDFTILDRWGNIHYEEKDFEAVNDGVGWKGMMNGQSSPKGVYFYKIRLLAINGEYFVFTGTINLM